ncbi:Ribose/Galactose Isomerase [Anaerobiospirillum thomasii]|uniref:Ribose/Galactose Isomerase n=1 Tax=Anaerobiospirillum thomasii TaxID=179995 RepID=A0A2X0V6C4_9GAMM|nr:RpiB/LacA/LacB family sugar-phosphate isomerase [Anaerobiospirillum thomasii]SPT68305.1 Ribose/Galactose Isomerase [Anaerobiospirillum thomasii]SPT68940.1 Ribose/Galactose Isomerase [Anaerobiospirillum thomasii]SPT71176.1 Ribose/Galactose Isomerase [Anaerobiospirillum thomasii]
MKIALVLENSQAPKNALIFKELNDVASAHGHEVFNYGMYSAEDKRFLTYVRNGLLASILLSTKAVDFVVTGCGTGEGACLACNAFPNVQCGHVTNPTDAYLFTQVNGGNAISLPYAQNFGWGGELNLRYTFEKLFVSPFGGGYPKERAEAEQANKKILDHVKTITHRPLIDILKDLDKDFVKGTIDDPKFAEMFYPNCQDDEIAAFLKSL